MVIYDTQILHIPEKIRAPFGFKGGYLTELWQTVCKIITKNGYGIGVGVQSVLWSEKNVFRTHTESEANMLMFSVSEYALKLLEGKTMKCPLLLMDEIYPAVLSFAQNITNQNKNLKQTFVRNALVPIDNALWQLYGRINGTENFLSIIPDEYRKVFTKKHKKLFNVPLITYSTGLDEVKKFLDDGVFLLKIKIGHDIDNNKKNMLEWDVERLRQIHNISKDYKSDYTKNGDILYYIDANGQYDNIERVLCFLDYAKQIGALDKIILFEEPFEEENKSDVSLLPVRITADESVHSVEDVEERANLGYKAIALKPIAKTMSETLKILKKAYERKICCFCADLTVNPFLVEFNKNFAARIETLPELKIGIVESNGNQNYLQWDNMLKYHPMYGNNFTKMKKNIYYLDESFYSVSGGIFKESNYYDNLFNKQKII
jgi:L-alanine-DL-glutamate epimerase-like enolase superfamily enzyme